jgi:2'-5' RNA ligase
MRLFAALPVAGAAREDLERLLGILRRESWPVRWLGPEALHLTLKFFGAVPEEQLAAIDAALARAVAGIPPLDLVLTEVSAFPDIRRPRVIWAGLEGPVALELLADRLERACEPLGFPSEGRPFRPHVTLGRVNRDNRWEPGAGSRLEKLRVNGGFLADQLVLYESQPTPEGSRYTVRKVYPLQG